jgi:hypothetical protein
MIAFILFLYEKNGFFSSFTLQGYERFRVFNIAMIVIFGLSILYQLGQPVLVPVIVSGHLATSMIISAMMIMVLNKQKKEVCIFLSFLKIHPRIALLIPNRKIW